MAPEVGDQPEPEITGTVAELAWWLTVVEAADRIHQGLPRPVREEIEAGASARELCRMALPLAQLSCATRDQIEATLRSVIVRLRDEPVSPPASGCRYLRVVARAAD